MIILDIELVVSCFVSIQNNEIDNTVSVQLISLFFILLNTETRFGICLMGGCFTFLWTITTRLFDPVITLQQAKWGEVEWLYTCRCGDLTVSKDARCPRQKSLWSTLKEVAYGIGIGIRVIPRLGLILSVCGKWTYHNTW